jgi:hypothetical protein
MGTLPPGRKPIPCLMVEKVKSKGGGSFDKVKMRCVVRGFLQKNGVGFVATYSPTAMMSSLRILLTAAVTHGWAIYELDVKNAYCHGIMDRETYISFPDGLGLADHEADGRPWGLLPKKGLYGTHQGEDVIA